MIELLAPAGDFASLRAALAAGANSVYLGATHLNLRSRSAHNFTFSELAEAAALCHKAGVRCYLTVNSVLHDHDLVLLDRLLTAARDASVDAVIVSDMATIQRARALGFEVHISTQLSISNYPSVVFFSQFADRIVLARELTLPQITHIIRQIQENHLCGPSGQLLQIECFAHGALCIAVSGRCFMSLFEDNASANRGACMHTCRKAYRVMNEETGEEMRVTNKYVFSPQDLCTLPFLDKLTAAGISVFKIEGRARSPEYVSTVVSCYRKALDAFSLGTFSASLVAELLPRLQSVYNRGFSEGFYFGRTVGQWSASYGSQATHRKAFVGKVLHYYVRAGVVHLTLDGRSLNVGDRLLIIGKTTGCVEQEISSLRLDDGTTVSSCAKGSCVTVAFSSLVRPNDRCYVIVPVSEVGAQS